MAYVSLYRKYRPQTFVEVVGQDHVTRTLTNAIDEDRLHHAYLFTGPRGTGKTSTARLLAKAINCEKGPTPTPCNACDMCEAITTGASVDVIELDMASHGGVDDARELRDRALFAPAQARKKVYILDEVHMASTAAFNALLKLIEEPPGHVLFAMATTDPQKVLPTIMSRVQRLDLRRINAADVAANVRRICDLEGHTIEDAAVEAIVRAGDGSLRDTQSILEQVLSFSGEEVTGDKVAQVLGQTPADRAFAAVDLVAARDLAGLLALVQGLLDDGHDLRRFAFDLVSHIRDLVVLQVAPDRPDLVDATDARRAQLAEQTGALPRETLLRAVDILAQTVAEMRQGPARLPLELALAKLAVPELGGDVSGLADRIARLEAGGRPAASTVAAASADVEARAEAAAVGAPAEAQAPPEADAAPEAAAPAAAEADDVIVIDQPSPPSSDAAAGDDLARVTDAWPGILDRVKGVSRRVHAVYEPAEPIRLKNGILTLKYPQRYASFHAQNAAKGEYAEALVDAVKTTCGLRIKVETRIEGDTKRRPQPPVVSGPPESDPAPEPTPEEQAEVREAEQATPAGDPDQAARAAADLIVNELDAEPVDDDATR